MTDETMALLELIERDTDAALSASSGHAGERLQPGPDASGCAWWAAKLWLVSFEGHG